MSCRGAYVLTNFSALFTSAFALPVSTFGQVQKPL